MKIDWENTRGGYYIKKLLAEADKQAENIGDIVEDMGDISNLTTTSKTNIVSAINELVSAISGLDGRVSALENPTEGGET